jgi:DNA gyrase/topoisomerase IV subunit B
VNDKYNKLFKSKTGYDVRKDGIYYTFDKGVYHANLKMDNNFVNHHFDEIAEKLNEIMIYGLYLRGKKSGKEYHGSIYYLMTIMNSILGPKIDIQRFKGLGEMCIEDLSETTINPMTRTLTQVTMIDGEKADKAMQIFMSDANIKFKRLYYAGKVDFD